MRSLIGLVLVMSFFASVGQGLTDDMKETEEQLYASTKQINQFFRRFNGEEDDRGDRYYAGDKKYRDSGLRRKYLPMLFDEEAGSSADVRKDFVKELTDRKAPVFLDFHRDDWVAEVNAQFRYHGQDVTALLYMKLQAQGQGYEWVIDDVSFEPLKSFFEKDTSDQKKFIHPMSHELEFMTLRKAFANNEYPEQYTPRSYEPDILTLFLYEMKRGNLKFKTVKNVRFHFFDIGGWYFELANFNRPGFNTGWLISNLMKIQNDQQLAILKAYIYDKN